MTTYSLAPFSMLSQTPTAWEDYSNTSQAFNISSRRLAAQISKPSIFWTEQLVTEVGVSLPETVLSMFLLTFAILTQSLASIVHSYRDSLPLDYTVVRTPLKQFQLPRELGYTFKSNFIQVAGYPRMHYLDEGPSDSRHVLLLLHGEPFWSQAWVKVIPSLSREFRVIVPDMIGFGLSDKWVDWRQYSLAKHAHSLIGLLDRLGLDRDKQKIVLVGHNWGWMVGAEVVRLREPWFSKVIILNTNNLPDGEAELSRFSSSSLWLKFQVMNSWFLAFRSSMSLLREYFPLSLLLHSLNKQYTPTEVSAFLAPWPNITYCGGTTSFPLLVPVFPSHPEAPSMTRLRNFLSQYSGPTLVLYSGAALVPWLQTGDFVVGNRPEFYRSLIPAVARIKRVFSSGHLVQYDQPGVVIKEIQHFLTS